AVEVKAGTVGDALRQLTTTHPELRRHLYTEDGKLRDFVNVYLNDEDVRYLQKENTPVRESDIFVVEVHVDEGTQLAVLGIKMAAQLGMCRGELPEGIPHGAGLHLDGVFL